MIEKDYKKWKRKNVTLRGVSDGVGNANGGSSRFGAGLYTAALGNREMAKGYGTVYFVVNARPKNPIKFKDANHAEIWIQNRIVFKNYKDLREFNKNTTIEAEMLKLGYDGLEVIGREIVNYTPENVLYFSNERQLMMYYEDNIEKQMVREFIKKTLQENVDIPQTNLNDNFWKWFNGSKVVDAHGNPLVVHHGTSEKFKVFNMKKTTQGLIWFTSNKSAVEAGEVGAQGRGNIMDLYVSMKNPAGWDEYDKFMLGQLRSEGYDGAILPSGDGHITGFVFEPNQVKSIANKGDWNPGNKNIFKETNIKNITEEFDKEFISKVKFTLKQDSEDTKVIIATYNSLEIGKIEFAYVSGFYFNFKEYFTEEQYDEMFPKDEFAEILWIKVKSEQNKGVASELMRKALNVIKKDGYDRVYLNASPIKGAGLYLDDLVGFYKKYGFKEILHQGSNVQMLLSL